MDGVADDVRQAPPLRRTTALKRHEYEVRDARRRLRALGLAQVTQSEHVRHTFVGLLSILFALVGVVVPAGLLAGIVLTGVGLYRARR